MIQRLPTYGFKWIPENKLTVNNVFNILNKSITNHGYVFEVDLEYPKELWKLHNDYPLAPHKIDFDGVEKLVSSFLLKTKYVLHYQNLLQYLQLGMKMKKVRNGIQYFQSEWMKPYIEKNTKLRMESKNSFEKDFFKLMNNSVFGKTIENIRKRQSIKILDNVKKAKKLTSKPNFKSTTIFNENLIAIHMQKTEIYFDKPICVGQAVLDLSKTFMFDFHYNYIKPKYGKKAELLFTDTDSLMYEIDTEDFYKDIKKDIKKRYDTSDIPPDHPSKIKTGINKKVIRMFKDEAAGKQILME